MMEARRRTPEAQRKAELATIHAAAHELGMADEVYRSMLERVTGLDSSKDMDATQRHAVIDELRRLGAKKSLRNAERATYLRKFKGKPASVTPDMLPMIGKVSALLTAGEKPWAYAHAIAKRMFNTERVEWLRPDQMHKLVAALNIALRRNKKRSQPDDTAEVSL